MGVCARGGLHGVACVFVLWEPALFFVGLFGREKARARPGLDDKFWEGGEVVRSSASGRRTSPNTRSRAPPHLARELHPHAHAHSNLRALRLDLQARQTKLNTTKNMRARVDRFGFFFSWYFFDHK